LPNLVDHVAVLFPEQFDLNNCGVPQFQKISRIARCIKRQKTGIIVASSFFDYAKLELRIPSNDNVLSLSVATLATFGRSINVISFT